jgi:hypoxanthine phosphoribosyltransferase
MIEQIIKTSKEIEPAISDLSDILNKEFHKASIDIILMNHAAKFLVADLMEFLDLDIRLQNLNFKNYESSSESGEVQITKDLEFPIFDRHVILADGILISGNTHFYVCNYLKQRLPKSLSIVSVGKKPKLLAKKIPNCYSLFNFNDEWVEGYGIGGSENKDKPYLVDTRR